MPNLLTLQTYLVEAETARHRLLTGSLEVTVSLHGFGTTTYNEANISKLEAYISDLKMQISKLNGSPRRAPIRMRF